MHHPEEIINGKYQITGILGEGGIAITYAAKDINNGEQVAIKVLSLEHITDWKILELFEREAKVLAQLNHPAIPRYIDYFEINTPENRAFYIVRQIAPGKSLADLVDTGWRTNEREVRRIAIQILSVLIYLHGFTPPIFHRDIKPQNIIYHDQKVYLIDFGSITNIYQNTIARGSTIVGTFGYMAPEQFSGKTSAASDLYSVGATLLFLLSHRSPSELPRERLKINFRNQIQISNQFADWLEKMLEPDTDARFSDANLALNALNRKQFAVDKSEIKNSLRTLSIVSILGLGLCIYTYLFRWQVWGLIRFFPPNICYPSNDGSIVYEYINAGGDIYAITDDQELIINCWVKNQDISPKVAKFIVSKVSDTNRKDRSGTSILHHANSRIWVKSILEKGADINIRINNDKKHTPLHLSYNKPIGVAESFIKRGADINVVDTDGKTPLNLLFESLVSVEEPSKEQIALVNLFVQNGAKINLSIKTDEGKTLLHQTKSAKLAEFIIAQGVDVNSKDENGNTLLHFAVLKENYELVNLLIYKNADLNLKNQENEAPLNLAIGLAYRGGIYNPQIAKLLINNGADINVKNPIENLSLLHLAVKKNDKGFINFLLDKGININAKDSSKSTALHSIIKHFEDDNQITLLLIKRGANICIRNHKDKSSLDIARQKRKYKPEIIEYIEKKGLDKKCNSQPTK